jgi:tetratricopeptide (TPR) repeat protein
MHSGFSRTAVIVVGLAVSMSACGKYSISNIRSLKAFKEGIVLYGKGDYKGAVPLFQDAVTRNPEFGLPYFYLGNSYDLQFKPNRKGEPDNDAFLDKAVDSYRKAIEKLKDSTEPRAAEFRKLSYEYLIAAYGSDKIDDFSKAEPVARELIAIEPNEPSNYQALGKLFEDQGQYEEAEAMFKKAIEVKPNDPSSYQLMAGFYNRQGKFEETMNAFQQRASMEPNNPEAWHAMGGYVFDKLGMQKDKSVKTEDAVKYIAMAIESEDKAIALNANYVEALAFKNLLLRLKANYEKNPAIQKQLLAEADQFKARADAAQAKAGEALAAAGKK